MNFITVASVFQGRHLGVLCYFCFESLLGDHEGDPFGSLSNKKDLGMRRPRACPSHCPGKLQHWPEPVTLLSILCIKMAVVTHTCNPGLGRRGSRTVESLRLTWSMESIVRPCLNKTKITKIQNCIYVRLGCSSVEAQ